MTRTASRSCCASLSGFRTHPDYPSSATAHPDPIRPSQSSALAPCRIPSSPPASTSRSPGSDKPASLSTNSSSGYTHAVQPDRFARRPAAHKTAHSDIARLEFDIVLPRHAGTQETNSPASCTTHPNSTTHLSPDANLFRAPPLLPATASLPHPSFLRESPTPPGLPQTFVNQSARKRVCRNSRQGSGSSRKTARRSSSHKDGSAAILSREPPAS